MLIETHNNRQALCSLDLSVIHIAPDKALFFNGIFDIFLISPLDIPSYLEL